MSNAQPSLAKGISPALIFLLVLALAATSVFTTPPSAQDAAASDLVVRTEAGLPPVIGDSKGSGSQMVPSLSREEAASCPCVRLTRIQASLFQETSAKVTSLSEYFPLRI